VFGPAPLYAGALPVPFGGGLSDFSRVGWVRPLTITKVAGDGQVAAGGTMVNRAPEVRVTSALSGAAIAGVPVVFTAGSGGSAAPATATTDASGVARTNWTLGSGLGPQTMTVQASNHRPYWPGRPGVFATTTFNARAIAPPALTAAFLAPLGPLTIGPVSWRADQAPILEICRLSGSSCVAPVATFTSFTVEPVNRAYRKDWAVPLSLTTGERYRFRVLVAGVQVGTATALARPNTATGEVSEPSFRVGNTLSIRFTIY
jgi:hypothetical protein